MRSLTSISTSQAARRLLHPAVLEQLWPAGRQTLSEIKLR
jgi:hypothetical protein